MKNRMVTASVVSVVALMAAATGVFGAQDTTLAVATVPGKEMGGMTLPSTRTSTTTDIRPDCVVLPVLPEKGHQQQAFEVGDKLKLTFYETVVDIETNKWDKARNPNTKSFQQRPEFSGEYTVQEDKTITVPLLGSISIDGRNAKQLQNALQAAFKEIVGHDGSVTVMSMERPPISVLGAKNSGEYKFRPGMTVLHAVTAAGGFDKESDAPWQQIEKVRQISARNGSIETMTELLAREAVYKAERDKVKPNAPLQLINLAGSDRASELIGKEAERRLAIVAARRERDWAMQQRIIAAQQQIDALKSRVGTMDPTIKMRKERVQAYETLMQKGTLARTTVLSAQAELSNDERTRGDMLQQLAQAEQALHQLQTEKATMEASTRSDLETAIAAVTQQIQSSSRDADTAGSILVAMRSKATPISATIPGVEAPPAAPKYEIVRQTDKGPTVFAAREMSVLRPGDLVRIAQPQAQQLPMAPGADDSAPSRTNAMPISHTTVIDPTGCKQPAQ